MSLLFLALALAATPPDAAMPGIYRSVAETEYAIELNLRPNGQAELELRMWIAGEEPQPTDTAVLSGTWSQAEQQLIVQLPSEGTATYRWQPCLSHDGFGTTGCSPGLTLVETTLPVQYQLHRYRLWRAGHLRIQP